MKKGRTQRMCLSTMKYCALAMGGFKWGVGWVRALMTRHWQAGVDREAAEVQSRFISLSHVSVSCLRTLISETWRADIRVRGGKLEPGILGRLQPMYLKVALVK